MKTKTKPTVAEQIQSFNDKYEKATKIQRRLMIIKDALAQLMCGKVKASHIYGQPETGVCINQETLHRGLVCYACADGALFLSSVRFRNQFDAEEVDGGDAYEGQLDFSNDQLAQIEHAYEAGDYELQTGGSRFKRAFDFGLRYKTDKLRMAAILKNMLRNKAMFKP